MEGVDNTDSYRRHVDRIVQENADRAAAMELAVGGDFAAMGAMQRDLLISQKLRADGSVIDVGCGSGRLALPLSRYLSGPYLGTDVVPELLDHAKSLVNRPDWRFELVDGFIIPANDEFADIVCFFSVFTHLRHEHSYRYLEEARRVVKPDGRIIFSFLDFRVAENWEVFERLVAQNEIAQPMDQFIGIDAIGAWADHLGLQVSLVLSGDAENIPLTVPVTMRGGYVYQSFGRLGQSVAVLAKPR